MESRNKDLEEFETKLGEKAGKLGYFLWNNITYLRTQWRVHKSIFGAGPERRQLLSDASDLVSWIIQRSLLDSVLTRIRALVLKGKEGEKNISLWQILDWLGESIDQNKFLADLNELSLKARKITVWVNKRVAHHDFDVRSGRRNIEVIDLTEIDQIIDEIDRIFRRTLIGAMKVEYSTSLISGGRDELFFMQVLHEGLAALDRKEELSIELMKASKWQEEAKLHEIPIWLKRDDKFSI